MQHSPRRRSILLAGAVGLAGAAHLTPTAAAAPARTAPVTPPAPALIPKPRSLQMTGGQPFEITADTAVAVRHRAHEARRTAEYLATWLRRATGYAVPVVASGAAPQAITLADDDETPSAEGYRLDVTHGGVHLRAAEPAGLFHATQTLRQLLPAAAESATPHAGPWTISPLHIDDAPRFPWRGSMLDVARHFFTADEVKRYIDILALYKINRLHLHLSDSQGWRLEIKSWPRLATYGGSTEVGGGPGGYFTQREYADIVRHAAEHHIMVIPEIDMPAHVNAAQASYAELTCDGVAPPLYTGETGIPNSLCIDKDLTYRFIGDVLGELADLTPGPYLHIGGDEALATKPEDYRTFISRAQQTVHGLGKQTVGWEEVGLADIAPSTVVQFWANAAKAQGALAQGAKLVLSPSKKAYFDMKYDADTPYGHDWAGYTDVQDGYTWDPATYIPGVTESQVQGAESALWTERVATFEEVQYMTLPRLPGIAEIGWSPVDGRAWEEYRVRLATHAPRWSGLGWRYHRSVEVPWG
ncbi:beta-N-acetylhexosaminidase [Streptomyces sp. NPDC057543]|uniref:beta-N-acetylhexosaminidase n=1 Tax=Streptomyces sp. NPDC057543 TaxID=3346163 RepID=UPI0036BBC5E9